MDKYRICNDIHEQIVNSTFLAQKTDEGRLMVGVVGQAIMDAMGLWGADCEESLSVGGYRMGNGITLQEEAVEWFRAKGHYPWLDVLEIEPSWIDWLIKNKAGVDL